MPFSLGSMYELTWVWDSFDLLAQAGAAARRLQAQQEGGAGCQTGVCRLQHREKRL